MRGAAWLIGMSMLPNASATGADTSAGPGLDLAAVDRFMGAQIEKHRIPGVALAITHGDQIIHVRGYGQARSGAPVTERTRFRLASLSKSFTAMAVFQLSDAGKIDIDQPVRRYLPDFALATPSAAGGITARHLLNHTSGLADAGFADGLEARHNTLAERVASLRSAVPAGPPGTEFRYFDPNYQVLARLVEVVSGQAFDAFLKTRVLAPLAMGDSVSAPTSNAPALDQDQLAQGHIVVYGFPVAMPEVVGFLGGSGGVVSTASDMAHSLIAHANGGQFAGRSVLSPANILLMHTPPAGIGSHYGMGWVASTVDGTQTVEHNGILSTFYAEAVLLPQSGYAFALLVNEYSLASSILAFPVLKRGVVALLSGRQPAHGGLGMPTLGLLLAAASALGIGLAIRSLLRLPQWTLRHADGAAWKLLASMLWLLLPAAALLVLPELLALLTGRSFGYQILARTMPELVIFLAVCGGLGLLNGVLRAVALVRKRTVRDADRAGAH